MLVSNKDYKDLVAYWRRLHDAGDGGLPARSAFSVTQVPHLMPMMFLFEVRGWTDLHVLFTGSALDRVMVTPMTGRNFLSFYPEEEWADFGRGTETTCTVPCGCRVQRDLVIETGESFHTESLVLPLADRAGAPRYLVGLFGMEIDAGQREMRPAPLARSHNLGISFFDIGYGAPPPLRIAGLDGI
ncbi:MAG: PAS domain-containing protein [Alphaproteobacteria bacterium]|nr:MAG: PAS domain-containing protein [Alphaproteobacteria bacterium]